MKMKKLLAILLALITMVSCVSTASLAFAENEAEVVVAAIEDRVVYYPQSLETNDEKHTVIVWANGTGMKSSYYADLLKGFAKEGYVVVASNETMAADGTDQIAGVDFTVKAAKDTESVLYNKVDVNKIVAMGHSQGGRSAVNAGAQDSRFCCVVSIAGSNYDYEAKLLSKPALFFTGTSDRIVSSSQWVKPAFDVCKGPAVYISRKQAGHTTCCNLPESYIYYSSKWISIWADKNKAAMATFDDGGELSKDNAFQDFAYKGFGKFKGSATISASSYVYDGKVKKPSVAVKDEYGRSIPASSYTVTYPSGRKAVGEYKVKIKMAGNYTGTLTKSFKILPKATALSKLTAKSKGANVTWKKQGTQTTGYEVQVATNSKFTKGVKKQTIKSNKTTSAKFTKLSGKKKYYVRIRCYKSVSGKYYYSSWSSVKTVTTKK